MQIRVSGKHLEIGETLPQRVRGKLSAAVLKYFGRSADANVTFTKERAGIRADCSVHLSSGTTVVAHGEANSAIRAFEVALDHLETQIRRYARRLKNHHERTAGNGHVARALQLESAQVWVPSQERVLE